MPRFSYLLLPGVLAIGLFFITSSFENREPATDKAANELAQNFVAFAEGINTALYDEQGELNYTLRADRQVQLNDDTSELTRPLISIFRDSRSNWNIAADSGTISAPAEDGGDASRMINMLGSVEIRSLDDQGKPIRVTTESLTFIPATETAETGRPVDFSMTNITHSSTGMRANLATDEIVFLSNNKGQYVRTSN